MVLCGKCAGLVSRLVTGKGTTCGPADAAVMRARKASVRSRASRFCSSAAMGVAHEHRSRPVPADLHGDRLGHAGADRVANLDRPGVEERVSAAGTRISSALPASDLEVSASTLSSTTCSDCSSSTSRARREPNRSPIRNAGAIALGHATLGFAASHASTRRASPSGGNSSALRRRAPHPRVLSG